MKQYTYELDTEIGYSTDACSRVLRIIFECDDETHSTGNKRRQQPRSETSDQESQTYLCILKPLSLHFEPESSLSKNYRQARTLRAIQSSTSMEHE